ncbi:hypothetical protein CN327_20585 [Bacillus cereus]|uniref:DUF3278 domain-containing protein n=1 Tax=Bacillus nitratireducens TaxID=2026193 RepID=A0ABU6PJL4_9BACI|nr:hypothetical protein [Bacillus nitratireducens]OSX98152.1 hypothetical protein BTJ45_05045 [Bacillus mycoides]PDY13424.1 hypothetical protein COM83_28195 [Bacillus cereus]MDR4171310.1 hypothetical protein [Bacillus nitratireducens]MED0902851.1 hypothetical protein [Bacillus nitratireducens]MED4681498.1 hypothetical protein [Bacillus nitratireducens]
MKNTFNQEFFSDLIILVLGSIFLYFNSSDEEKIRSVLLFAAVYILLALVLFVVKRIFFKKKKKGSEKYPLPEMDERIEKMSLKLMAQIFGLSHLIGSAILFVLYITNENSTIRVEYALYYLFGILFFTMMFGLKIVKKLDN